MFDFSITHQEIYKEEEFLDKIMIIENNVIWLIPILMLIMITYLIKATNFSQPAIHCLNF